MKYDKRGVSADKSDVHAAIKGLDKGLYPNAFCKILADFVGNDPAYCNIMHADTAGTKTSLAYLYWRETGNLDIWKNIIQDALVMNLDDLACVGLTSNFVVSSTIGRNKRLITGEVVAALIQGASAFAAQMHALDIELHLAGGETADVGDIVRTVDVGFTVFGRLRRNQILENNIQAGDVIVGLSATGQASYETAYNSGIGSNGLTSARHDALSHYYAHRFPESYDAKMPDDVAFIGSRRLTDTFIYQNKNYTVGDLLLSPTRTYLPVLRDIFVELHPHLHGVIHCSGGGQTKVGHFQNDQTHIIKDNLFALPPVFALLQTEGNTAWSEMYKVFNMGHRLEVYLSEAHAQPVIAIAKKYNIDAQIVGRVEPLSEGKRITIRSEFGEFVY